MKINLTGMKVALSVVLLIAITTSCKKFHDPEQFFEEYGVDSTVTLQRKVLVISIDGVAGPELSAIAPPNISALQKTGKFTYSMRKDDKALRAASLASIINGVSSAKHLITDSTFVGIKHGDTPEDAVIPHFPNMFNYLLQRRQDITTGAFTSWQPYNRYLRITDYHPLTTSDVATKDSAVHYLKTKNPLGAALVNFHDVDVAGKAGLYQASDAGYKAAIEKVDGYVGELVNAIKARPNYANEDWLIMLVSAAGGEGITAKPGFLLVSNPRLKEKEVRKTGFNSVRFGWDEKSAQVRAQTSDDGGLYNSGTNKDFTAQITAKFISGKSWPAFFGKSTGVSGQTVTGWVMLQSGNVPAVIVGGSGNGTPGKLQVTSGITVADGKWHTITATVKTEGTVRRLRLYVDGETSDAVGTDIGARNLSTSWPLTLGHVQIDGSGHSELNAINALYFNKALDQATIKSNLNLLDMTKHTEYSSITGYWPLDDGVGPVMANLANGAAGIDFNLQGPYTWKNLNDQLPPGYTVDPNEQSIIAAPYDVAAIMMYWLKVEIPPAWNLDGASWLRYFDREIFGQ